MSGLTWHHISDWLQKGKKEFDCQVIQAAPIRDIRGGTAIGPDLSMMDIIISSGNIACSKKSEEYDAAKRDLLDSLLKACDVGPHRHFMVPGSHDMDRTVFETSVPDQEAS